MATIAINVFVDPAREIHICQPTKAEVSPGDIVIWTSNEPLLFFFPDESPVVEGRGPFANGQPATVKPKGSLTATKGFPVVTALSGVVRETEGDIIVT